jgi:hypothetical protein
MSNTIPLVSLSGTTLFTFTYNSYDETIINSLRDCIQKHYKYYYVIINDEKIIYYNLYTRNTNIDITNINHIIIIIIHECLGKIIEKLRKYTGTFRISYFFENINNEIIDYILNNKDILLLILKYDFNILELLTENIINDQDFILDLVKQNGAIYKHKIIQTKYKNNKKILLEAVKSSLQMYPIYYFRNTNMGLEHIYVLEHCDFRNDFDVVLQSVKTHGISLKYASIKLKNNYTIVLEAIKQNPFALQYASIDLKNNYTIVNEAVCKNGIALKFASYAHKNNLNIILSAINNRESSLSYATPAIKNDLKIMLSIITDKINLIQYVSEELKDTKEFILPLIKKHSIRKIYKHISDRLKNDHIFSI